MTNLERLLGLEEYEVKSALAVGHTRLRIA